MFCTSASSVSSVVESCSTNETQTRHPERLPAGRDGAALRPRRLHALRQLAVVLPDRGRPRDRMHADSRAGNGAVRLRRRARRRAHRPGLDCGARARRRHDGRPDEHRGPHLREAELRQGAMGPRGAGRLGHAFRRRHGRQDHRHRAGARHARLFRAPRREGQRRIFLGRHRSEAAGAGRRDRRSDRNRLDAARQPAAHSRHGDGVEYPAHRQPLRARRRRGSGPRSRTSRCC